MPEAPKLLPVCGHLEQLIKMFGSRLMKKLLLFFSIFFFCFLLQFEQKAKNQHKQVTSRLPVYTLTSRIE